MSTSTDTSSQGTQINQGTQGTTHFEVTGMTCGHCVMAVTRELTALPGVREVRVTLATGDVAVTHDELLDSDQVAAAIDEAGYQLAR